MKKMFLIVAIILTTSVALAGHNSEHDQFDQVGFFTVEVQPNVYLISSGAVNNVLVVTATGAILIDASPFVGITRGKTIVDAIVSITDHPVEKIIYTHSHSDHIGSAGLVVSWMQENFPKKQVRIFAHENTKKKLLDENASVGRPLPTNTFSKNRTLQYRSADNRSRTISLVYLGTNHSDDNIFIYLPEEELLIWVDVVNPLGIPFTFAHAESAPGYIRSHEQALTFSFTTLLPGHAGIGDRQHIKANRVFLADLAEKSLTALFETVFNFTINWPFDTTDDLTVFYEEGDAVFVPLAERCVELMTDPVDGNADLVTGEWELTTGGQTFGPLGGVTPNQLLGNCSRMTVTLFTNGFPFTLDGVGGGVSEVVNRLNGL